MAESSALADLKVLDLTNLLSAPQIGATLADFGADVVKIEPRAGDPIRRIGIQREGGSPQWALVSRNKRAITLDLDQAEGQRVFRSLVDRADVLIENLTPNLVERWKCSFAALAPQNPRLVVVSVSCYGRTGPYSDRAGAGTLAEAFAGFAHMNGEADGPPMVPSLPLGDTLAGFSGVIGTLMALYARDREGTGSGRGQHVDVTMIDPILQLLALPLANYDGRRPGPARMGSRVAGGVPRNLYRARDGHWMALSGTTDAQVARILGVIGLDSEDARERFGRSEARLRRADELDGAVATWIAGHSRAEAFEAFHAARIPVAPVNDLAAILDDPHVRERASVVVLEDSQMGELPFVAPAPRLSATPGQHCRTGPALGEHNAEVYREWLGLDAEAVAALERGEVI
ncbi:MAG: CoA transferase [Deltaproteobacteria bacterium]|nr:CoA transferase [Deltaproteobacteria bacterium]